MNIIFEAWDDNNSPLGFFTVQGFSIDETSGLFVKKKWQIGILVIDCDGNYSVTKYYGKKEYENQKEARMAIQALFTRTNGNFSQTIISDNDL